MSKRRLLTSLLGCTTRQAVVNRAVCERCAERSTCKSYASLGSSSHPTFSLSLQSVGVVVRRLSSDLEFDVVCSDTLDHLTEVFEELPDFVPEVSPEFDVEYSGEVLTVTIKDGCTYVINRQTPNKQIWLSSPLSGPKRYSFVEGDWRYSHDNSTLIELLEEEISKLLDFELEFNSVRHCLLKYT